MSNDDEHGPTGIYPDGWDPDAEELHQESSGDVDDGSGVDVDAADVDGAGDDEPDAVPISVDDRPSDMRSYECEECSASIDYLDSECENEHEQQWYAQ